MTEQLIHRFDRLQWLRTKAFLSRSTIFLDLRYWIGMSEGRDASHIELRNLLSELAAAGKAICPVSPTLLLELKKRPSSEKRTKYCQLMDQLSQGLSIRNWLVIFKEEFKSIVEGRQIDRQIAYSHFVDALSAGLRVNFDESWAEADAIRASELILDFIDKLPISEIVEVEIDGDQEGSLTFLRSGLSRLTQEEQQWRQNHHESLSAIERAEFAATVRSVLPQILSSPTEISPSLSVKLLTTSIEEKANILNQCPTFWCQHKLMTALRSNREKLNENDLWDLEHVASALPYVDCLACDGGTRHLCSEVLKLDSKYNTTIVSSVDALLAWTRDCLSP